MFGSGRGEPDEVLTDPRAIVPSVVGGTLPMQRSDLEFSSSRVVSSRPGGRR